MALGMGINLLNVDLVIHMGSPKNVLSYWQDLGHCDRDMTSGHLNNNDTYVQCVQHLSG